MLPIIFLIAAFVATVVTEAIDKKFPRYIAYGFDFIIAMGVVMTYKLDEIIGFKGTGILLAMFIIIVGFSIGALIRTYGRKT